DPQPPTHLLPNPTQKHLLSALQAYRQPVNTVRVARQSFAHPLYIWRINGKAVVVTAWGYTGLAGTI
ncbi:MAG: hypothetical protein NT154_36265, partial [Verrucomicrobia bacterium]|nr:hypothetical protein [Verrucomicrobiota bacterium]